MDRTLYESEARTNRKVSHFMEGAIMSFFVFCPVGILLPCSGFMRANPWLVLFFMTLGKFARYVVVGFGLQEVISWF